VLARSEAIGVGCVHTDGVPILKVANGTAPVLRTQLDSAYRNGPTSPLFKPVISKGFDDKLFNGIPLPLGGYRAPWLHLLPQRGVDGGGLVSAGRGRVILVGACADGPGLDWSGVLLPRPAPRPCPAADGHGGNE
jgi:hypothetical protein